VADVKWIKIVTDIFDDEKILLVESMPSADSIIVIWFKLLCLAGKNNNSGVFTLSDKIPYTDEMLATIFRRDLNTVRLALSTFEKFGMVEIVNNVITIPNWSKHQNLDQLEARKEYMREYMQGYRDKQKQLTDCKVNSKTNSKVNVNSLEEDKNKIRIELEEEREEKEKKHKYGVFFHILLKDSELEKLNSEYGELETQEAITYLDEYIEMKGTKYKSHYMALRKWVYGAVSEKRKKSSNQPSNFYDDMERWAREHDSQGICDD
jgi:predicted phage replisome organizer